ncbi:RNase adapter RapZ [Qingshengfaniella alkalisoli]|uniref:RNase adapter RapZ n=1 Tax=Qingshengfaniella alkalisoli TaxID=2599296 RepID=A0A5B8ITQ1_9RHOB|nr:RNase adapter RapZ [Qingshengfaniella alkalisoli]QDY68271.1 RNase adapter RapZ [Qingshengfaniella alkalisoli]
MRPNGQARSQKSQQVILITGPSGAGRSTAENVLEDLGCETIDNLPLSLLPRLIDGVPMGRPLALGIDVRNREFSTQAVLDMIAQLSSDPRIDLEVLYLDCRADVLSRRYSETRRRHPLAPAEAPELGIKREFDLLERIRLRSDILLDTSDLTPHDLRAELKRWFDAEDARRLAVSVHSFSYKRGVPNGIDLLFDCRFLANPYWEKPLRRLDGRDQRVADYVAADPRSATFFDKTRDLVRFLLPAYVDEGKAHLSIGFGCTGGQHRSVVLAERMARALAEDEWQVSIRHHELERRGHVSASTGSGDKG